MKKVIFAFLTVSFANAQSHLDTEAQGESNSITAVNYINIKSSVAADKDNYTMYFIDDGRVVSTAKQITKEEMKKSVICAFRSMNKKGWTLNHDLGGEFKTETNLRWVSNTNATEEEHEVKKSDPKYQTWSSYMINAKQELYDLRCSKLTDKPLDFADVQKAVPFLTMLGRDQKNEQRAAHAELVSASVKPSLAKLGINSGDLVAFDHQGHLLPWSNENHPNLTPDGYAEMVGLGTFSALDNNYGGEHGIKLFDPSRLIDGIKSRIIAKQANDPSASTAITIEELEACTIEAANKTRL